MKKIYKYSEKKFLSFSVSKQYAILLEILEALEKSFDNVEQADLLRSSFIQCSGYISYPFKDLTIFKNVIDLRDCLNNEYGHSLRDSDIVVKRFDKFSAKKKLPFVLVLDNLRSSFNVGAILRSAECFGVEKVILCGTTPTEANRKVKEISMGTYEFLSIEHELDTEVVIRDLQSSGYEVIAMELTKDSQSLSTYTPKGKIAIIVGNESLGIDEHILSLSDVILEIPLRGWKNSLNVSNATAIALYDISCKLTQ